MKLLLGSLLLLLLVIVDAQTAANTLSADNGKVVAELANGTNADYTGIQKHKYKTFVGAYRTKLGLSGR
ncbi:hypothetical protein Aduo_015504 [Ancylostoma duodenale]